MRANTALEPPATDGNTKGTFDTLVKCIIPNRNSRKA
jgi:hypothetical protein